MDPRPESHLFVNKTQSSHDLSRSKASERSRILSHVQSNRRRVEIGRKSRPWSQFTTTFAPLDASSEATTKITKQKIRHATGLAKLYPSNNAYDPFHCTVAHTDAGTHAILQITFSHASRSNFLAESFAPEELLLRKTEMRHDKIFRLRMNRCIEDETLMYATLAYGSSLLGWMMDRFEPSKPPEYFLDKALRAVRIRLSDPLHAVDDWLLLSMYALAVTEMWNGLPVMWANLPDRHALSTNLGTSSFKACRTHLKALLHIVTAAGGWHHFDPYVLDSVVLADKYLAISDAQPLVVPLTWDPGPVQPEFEQQRGKGNGQLSLLGTSLMGNVVTHELEIIIQDLVAYCRIAENDWEGSVIRSEKESWLFRRLQAITCRLISHLEEEKIHYSEQCICLAALAFICSCTHSRGPQFSAQTASKRLHGLLQSRNISKQELGNDVRFWVLSMGALVPNLTPERGWFVNQLAHLCVNGYSDEWFVAKLETFLFLRSRQSSQLLTLNSELQASLAEARPPPPV